MLRLQDFERLEASQNGTVKGEREICLPERGMNRSFPNRSDLCEIGVSLSELGREPIVERYPRT